MIMRGTYVEPLKSLRKNFFAAFLSAGAARGYRARDRLDRRPATVMGFRVDREEDLVQMPLVAGSRLSLTELIGIGLPEFPAPLPDRFVGDEDSTG